MGIESSVTSLDIVSIEDPNNVAVTCLLELSSDVLQETNDDIFSRLQKLLKTAAKVIWATLGTGLHVTNPNLAKREGLTQSISSEHDDTAFTIVSFTDADSLPSAGSRLAKVVAQIQTQDRLGTETHYIEHQGLLGTMRVVPEAQISDSVTNHCLEPRYRSSPSTKIGGPPRKNAYLEIGAPGLLNPLHSLSDSSENAAIRDEEIEAEISAAGLNVNDFLIALGRMQSTYIGREAAGVVSKVDSAAGFEVGDRVACYSPRAIRSVLRCPRSDAFKVSQLMPFEVAANLPAVYGTAYYALCKVARLQKGESVLVHAGAGGVGQAAVQLAQYLGAAVLATVGSSEERPGLDE